MVVVTTKTEAQEYLTRALERLFIKKTSRSDFTNGLVRRRGRRPQPNKLFVDVEQAKARRPLTFNHWYFRNVSQPDPENAVKEAVCAVEAAARALFPDHGATLGEIVKGITGNQVGQLPKAIAKTFDGLYGFRSGGEGVGHGGAAGGAVTRELAEYSLAVAASQIVLLVDLAAASEPDVPF
jgi:hypothetical protein